MNRTVTFGKDRSGRHESVPSQKQLSLRLPVGSHRQIVKVIESKEGVPSQPPNRLLEGSKGTFGPTLQLPSRIPVGRANSKQVETRPLSWYKGTTNCRSCVGFESSKVTCQPLRPIGLPMPMGGYFPRHLKINLPKENIRKSLTIANNGKNSNKLGLHLIPGLYGLSLKTQTGLNLEEPRQDDLVGLQPNHAVLPLEHATLTSQVSEEKVDDHHTPLPSIVAQPFPKPARQKSLFPYRKSIRGSPTVPRLLGDPIELDVMEGDSFLAESCPHSMQLCHEGKKAVFEATGSESLFLKKPQIFSWRSSLQLGFPNLLTCDACRGSNHYLCAPGISFLGYSQQYSPPCKCNHVISLKSDRSEEQLPEESSSSLGKVEVSLQDAPSHLFSKTRPRILNNSGPNSSSSWSD